MVLLVNMLLLSLCQSFTCIEAENIEVIEKELAATRLQW